MPTPSEPLRTERDEAYASLEGPDALPVLSLVALTVALAARPLVRLLPPELLPHPWRHLLPVAVALAASALGTLLASWGLRRAGRRGLARVALLLNGIALLLATLVAAGVLFIVRP